MRKAISITLSDDNLLWLRGQAARSARGNVSALVDRLVGEARSSGRTDPAAVRSVVSTIDLPDDDRDLAGADAYIRGIFATSAQQPMVLRERPAAARKGRQRG